MQTRHVSIVLASVLAIGVSLSAAAAEKMTGIHKEFQRVSEAVANVPGQPGRTLRQVSIVWKSTSSNPIFDQAWVSAVAQIDALGEDSKEQGYGTSHYPSGDVNYFTWEGAIKHTVKEGGDYDRVAQGKFTWLGGTGKFKTIKGSGMYTCKFTSKGGQCDWEGEPEM